MSGDLDYADKIKKAHSLIKLVDSDWDGATSEWFSLDRGAPIKGFLLRDLVSGDLTMQVSEKSDGADFYELSIAEDLTSKSGDLAVFVPELAPFPYARWKSTGTQLNGVVNLFESA